MADQVAGNPGPGPETAEQPPAGPDGNAASPIQALMAMAAAGEDVWTLDEMEQAEPCDIIEIDEDELAAELDELAPVRAADGGQVVEGGNRLATRWAPNPRRRPAATTTRRRSRDSRSQLRIRSTPYRSIGKLFFKRGSSSFVCSAASIGGDAIWTAGHCLHAGTNQSDG